MAIRDITLGQFYPCDSVIHRLDARTKILGTLVFLVSLFLVQSFTFFAAAALSLAAVIRLSRVPLRFIVKGLKPVVFIIIFTMVLNLFVTQGEAIWSLGPLKLTREGVYRASFMAIRLILLILGSSVLTLTTKPLELTDGMEKLLSPFGKIGLPAHELAMMMSIALRFIPTLIEETDKIMSAQKARGADFETGSIVKRAKALIPILVPLFVSAFRRADELAVAMESRCYHGGEGRTKMYPLKMAARDYFVIALGVLLCAACITLGVLGI